jgi:hypothetical protein
METLKNLLLQQVKALKKFQLDVDSLLRTAWLLNFRYMVLQQL